MISLTQLPSTVRPDPVGRWIVCGVLAATLLASGCTSTSFDCSSLSCCNGSMYATWRDHVWAKRAYHQMYAHCSDPHPLHFRRGFIAGYEAVCRGDDGYVPAMPPRSYWGYAYQSADGQELVNSWFAGYPEGVKAALHEGAGDYRDVQVSSMLNAAMQPVEDPWEGVRPSYVDPSGQTIGSEIVPEPVPAEPQANFEMPPHPDEPPIIPATGAHLRARGLTPWNNAPLAVPGLPVTWPLGR